MKHDPWPLPIDRHGAECRCDLCQSFLPQESDRLTGPAIGRIALTAAAAAHLAALVVVGPAAMLDALLVALAIR